MIKTRELKARQICFFSLSFLAVGKFFMMPEKLYLTAKNDIWISAIITLIINLSVIISILLYAKKSDLTFYKSLELTFGKSGKNVILFLYFIFFLLKSLIPVNEQKQYVELTLYLNMPKTFYFFPFFFVCFYICTKKLRVIGRASDIMAMLSTVGIIIIIALSFKGMDFSNVKPIGITGAKNIFSGSLRSIPWLSDGVYFLFFLGEFNLEKKDGIKIIISFIISAMEIVLFLIVFICVFGNLGFRQIFALTETTKYTSAITNTGRFDYIGIAIILLSNLFALSLPLFFASSILNEIFSIKNKFISPLITTGIIFIITTFFDKSFYSIENFIFNYGVIYMLVLGIILPLIFSMLLKKQKTAYSNNEKTLKGDFIF